jgi:hypothetical protein
MKKFTLLLITIFSLIFISCPENGYGCDDILTTISSSDVKVNETITLNTKIFSWIQRFKDLPVEYYALPEDYSVLKGKFINKTTTPEGKLKCSNMYLYTIEDPNYYNDKNYITVNSEKVKSHYETSVSLSFPKAGTYKVLVGFFKFFMQEFTINVTE